MTTIHGFIGVIGSGKDYRANDLVRRGCVRVDFKDALLDMASDLVGFDVRRDYDWFKQSLPGMVKVENPIRQHYDLTDIGNIAKRHPSILTGRKLLQRLGTNVMRARDANYWVREWEKRAEELLRGGLSVCVADCRFQNEVGAMKRLGHAVGAPVAFRFCDYRSERYNPFSDHESEHLAQALLRLGLKDGQEITDQHWEDLRCGETK